ACRRQQQLSHRGGSSARHRAAQQEGPSAEAKRTEKRDQPRTEPGFGKPVAALACRCYRNGLGNARLDEDLATARPGSRARTCRWAALALLAARTAEGLHGLRRRLGGRHLRGGSGRRSRSRRRWRRRRLRRGGRPLLPCRAGGHSWTRALMLMVFVTMVALVAPTGLASGPPSKCGARAEHEDEGGRGKDQGGLALQCQS